VSKLEFKNEYLVEDEIYLIFVLGNIDSVLSNPIFEDFNYHSNCGILIDEL